MEDTTSTEILSIGITSKRYKYFIWCAFWQIYYYIDTLKFATAQKIVCIYGYRSAFG